MFPKGSRFPANKLPNTTAPNANQESQPDTYKRGTFLDKSKPEEKPSEITGPGAYNTNLPVTTKALQNSNMNYNERYAVLQRQLETLEQVHSDGKKSHATEVERLKSELSRSQKLNSDNAERVNKLKKQNDVLETRLQELRKLNESDQKEIKDLCTKLWASEHERGQLALKYAEASEVKKDLATTEAKRKEESRDRDKKIADLERSLTTEKRKREAAEMRLQEVKGKVDIEARSVNVMQSQIKEAKEELQAAEARVSQVEDREQHLIHDLENARSNVQRVAEEYGRLAASTVSLQSYEQVKHERVDQELRVFRLEKKLTNSEAQVIELAHLIRATKEQNIFLTFLLEEAAGESKWRSEALRQIELDSLAARDIILGDPTAAIEREFFSQKKDILEAESRSHQLFSEWDGFRSRDILHHYITLSEETEAQETIVTNLKSQREELVSQVEVMKREHEATLRKAAEYSAHWEQSKLRENELKGEIDAREKKLRTENQIAEEKLKTERESVVRLTSLLEQKKAAEAALCSEIEQLTKEVADADKYQEAYTQLLEEVGALIERNSLAEDEAEKLSKFNAEILSHNNPAQRIMYVDRIRTELAETKQMLLTTLRDCDAAYADNEQLKHELDMYTSVSVPIQDKPRTTMTRVARVPLANHNLNLHGT